MTDVGETTVTRPADATWRDFGAWLYGKRVTVCAVVLAGALTGLDGFVLSRGFFQQDDFAIAGLASHGLTVSLLFQNYGGHLMPGVFALAWLLVHDGGGYDWGLWAGSLVVVHVLAALAMLRALRTLFGNRMAVLIPLAVFMVTPLTVATLSWWAAGVQAIPLQLAVALAVDQHVRYLRTGRSRNAVLAVCAVLLGLAFSEKGTAVPLLLLALTSAFPAIAVPGAGAGQPAAGQPGPGWLGAGWPAAARGTLRAHWRLWLCYAVLLAAECAVYIAALRTALVKPATPPANKAVAFGWGLIRDTFIPGAAGGPWRWTLPPGASRSWALAAYTAPPHVPLIVSWFAAAAAVLASMWYRRHAGRAWCILLGWLVLVDIVPVALGRLVAFGSFAATAPAYVADALLVLTLTGALAFLPLRGEAGAYRATVPAGWRRGPRRVLLTAAAVSAAAAFGTGTAWSDGAYRGELHPGHARSYLATASAALAKVPPDSVIYPSQIPSQMAWSLLGERTQVQNALAPLAIQVPGQTFRWTAAPYGAAPDFYIFDSKGRLHPADVAGPHSLPFRTQSQCFLTARGMHLPLIAAVYPLPLLLRLGYFAPQPVTLIVTFGGRGYRLSLPATVLGYGYLPVRGPGDAVDIAPASPDTRICLGTVTVGTIAPASGAAPVPVTPLPG